MRDTPKRIQSKNAHDVFVSYAHNDNKLSAGIDTGWISAFVMTLKDALSKKTGTNCDSRVWMDLDLSRNNALTPQIEDKIKKSKVFILFVSKSYLNSDWCTKELNYFYKCVGENSGRIFVIELDKLSHDDKPKCIQDLIPYRFWEKTKTNVTKILAFPQPYPENDKAYYDGVIGLSHDLALKLNELEKNLGIKDYKAVVYLAVVSDSLIPDRNAVKALLQQNGIKVLPEGNAVPVDLKNRMEADLSKCSHFIQLLNTEYNGALAVNQHFVAEDQGVTIIQWRDHSVEMTESLEPDHQELLRSETVIESHRVDFQLQLLESIFPRKKVEYNPVIENDTDTNKIIFINTSIEDMHCAEKIADALRDADFGIILTRLNKTPEEIRKESENSMIRCDIMLVLQRKSSSVSIEKKLEDIELIDFQRGNDNPLKTYVCRSTKAPILHYWPPNNIKLLKCNDDDVWRHCMSQFIEEVGNAT